MSRFRFVKWDKTRDEKGSAVVKALKNVEHQIAKIEAGRCRSEALRSLEEAYLWTQGALRDEQLKVEGRQGVFPL